LRVFGRVRAEDKDIGEPACSAAEPARSRSLKEAVAMENSLCETPELVVAAATGPGEPAELVRGEEQRLLERVLPLVGMNSVALDLSGVERIDAAGIGALIALYREACTAGHSFSVVHATPRVAGILEKVGLAKILVSPGALAAAPATEQLADAAA
jgi:anti-anti-sigma factor